MTISIMLFQFLYLVCCLYFIWEMWRRNSKKPFSPPELRGRIPIIGHAWRLIGDSKHALDFALWLSKEVLACGGSLTIDIGPRTFYLLSDPDDCALVSNACLDKDYFYDMAKSFLGNGLTIADVPLWKQHRKLVSPTFRQQILNEFLVVFNRQGRKLVQQFQPELDNGPFNHEDHIRLNNLESICMTAFGADIAELGGLHKQYMNGVNDILEIYEERFQKFWLHSDFIFNWSSLKKRQDAIIRDIEEFTFTIFQKRKAEMKEGMLTSDKTGQFTPFMNMIMEMSQETGCYSDRDILHEINTIVGGGYDTSACTITLALMLLGSHPEAQEKVYKELQEVFENSDRDVEKDDVPKLIYLEAVLKETMRLYPIAPVVARYIVKDVQLKNYTLKAGNGVALMFWALHRHALWGEDVEKFRPDRWLEGNSSTFNNAFAGFSLGRRGCIGKPYAMISMKTVLSHVLRSYVISSDISVLELKLGIILKLASGQNISIKLRKSE